ncbi:PhyH-domain-containing protein [Annulohypoxylon truncatum]|uniref:PhyH-domain-containing protein n=1 Tax=Annulohypoxylon truncatum TaxID=327061 RepID=UPI002008CD59|nr:PhyH-domain-containing protein [Annulohypoxylon truncatum]KAI1214322.1 PhyH-domain-containing protein [Annulohypoxylon truncatum]
MAALSHPQPQIQRFPVTSDGAAVYKALADDGVVIIEGFLSPEQVTKLNRDVDAPLISMREDGKISKPPKEGQSTYWMADIVPQYVQRVHNLVGFSKVFRHEILNHELMHELCRLAFEVSGDYWLGYGAVMENGPGTHEQSWHRDQPNYPLLRSGPGTAEGMLNFFTALTDFTPENGRTQYIWGSHKLVEIGEPDAEHPVVFSDLKAGDTAVLSGKIVHRGSLNATLDTYRRALALIIIPGVLTPFDATCQLPRRVVETMTPLAQRMVGRRSVRVSPPSAIGIWCLNMREVGEQMGLKSNQPDEEGEEE